MKSLDWAVKYLSVKPRSKAQVRKYLQNKEVESVEIEEAITQLEEYNYLDDKKFASMYFELGFEKGHGTGRIRRELAEKGIERKTIDEAYNDLETIPNQLELAMEVGGKMIDSIIGSGDNAKKILQEMSYNDREKLKAKIARRLATRGYSSEITFKVAKKVTKG